MKLNKIILESGERDYVCVEDILGSRYLIVIDYVLSETFWKVDCKCLSRIDFGYINQRWHSFTKQALLLL